MSQMRTPRLRLAQRCHLGRAGLGINLRTARLQAMFEAGYHLLYPVSKLSLREVRRPKHSRAGLRETVYSFFN